MKNMKYKVGDVLSALFTWCVIVVLDKRDGAYLISFLSTDLLESNLTTRSPFWCSLVEENYECITSK